MDQTAKLLVDKMDELLGIAGARIESYYPYLLKQQLIEGWSLVVSTVFFLIVAVVAWIFVEKTDSFDDFGWILGVFTAIFGVLVVFTLSDGVSHILNPDFCAVKELIYQIRPQ